MALVEAIKNLPEREQYVMSMYYEHDMNLKEIAAVLGIGRFQSAFDLWWSKRLNDRKDDNAAMSRGRRCEPLVLEDFTEQYPHLRLRHVGLVRSIERPWQVATPDAIAYETCILDASGRCTASNS